MHADIPGRTRSRSAPLQRDRAATEDRILEAVGAVLARDGFSALGVNAIAKQAGVDKVLIYRYFGGLPELLGKPAAERYTRFFEHFIDELRARPLTLEILAAEVNDRNELTAILETERELWGEQASRVLGGAEFAAWPQARASTNLLVAGVMYLLVRARRIRLFGGMDLHSDDGWTEIKQAIGVLARQMFTPPLSRGNRDSTQGKGR